jgi:SARP family transcriptional regulator, regulator of embCAB operon
LRYELLGPLRVVDGDRVSSISAQKIEMLFAVLLVRAEQVVTADQLISEIWRQKPPRRATTGLHVYISQLRKFLDRPGRESPVITRSPGYLLRVRGDELDLRDFQRLVGEGRAFAKSQQHEEAIERFDSALRLWRGPAFGALWACPIVNGCATWLNEARVECIEMQIDAGLVLGQHRELVGRLHALIEEHPLREAFYRQLMLALYRSERAADALKVYQSARRTLRDELGLEPCRPLRNLQRAVLQGDDRLDLVPAG